jgi:hypothetical protein
MVKYTPPSIEKTGLKKYLDSTISIHNGYTYDDLVKMRQTTPPVNKANMARIFQVDRQTIDKWLKIYEKEGIES